MYVSSSLTHENDYPRMTKCLYYGRIRDWFYGLLTNDISILEIFTDFDPLKI